MPNAHLLLAALPLGTSMTIESRRGKMSSSSTKVKWGSQNKLASLKATLPVFLSCTFVLILGDPEIPIYQFASRTMWNPLQGISFGTTFITKLRRCEKVSLFSAVRRRQHLPKDSSCWRHHRSGWKMACVARIVMTTTTFNDCWVQIHQKKQGWESFNLCIFCS